MTLIISVKDVYCKTLDGIYSHHKDITIRCHLIFCLHAELLWETGGYAFETRLKLKYRETSFVNNTRSNCPIVLTIWTAAVFCTKFQNDWVFAW